MSFLRQRGPIDTVRINQTAASAQNSNVPNIAGLVMNAIELNRLKWKIGVNICEEKQPHAGGMPTEKGKIDPITGEMRPLLKRGSRSYGVHFPAGL